MKNVGRRGSLAGIAGCVLMGFPHVTMGCATCGGQSDSPLALGMNMAIFSMLGVLLTVMGLLVALFIHLARRSARQALMPGQNLPNPVERL
jgi:hypothetical protein